MKCDSCANQMRARFGPYRLRTKELGEIRVPNIAYLACKACDERLLDPEQAKNVTSYAREQVSKAISNLPVGQFVSMVDAAELLGISKQAFSKNARIRRGSIYSQRLGDRLYYYKPSVDAYKNTGDGRVRLTPGTSRLTHVLTADRWHPALL